MDFYQRDFLTLLDYNKEEIEALIDLGIKFKKLKESGISHRILKYKSIALVFKEDSTIARCAFEVAAYDLGMHVTCLEQKKMGCGENIIDNIQFLSSIYDGIAYYGFSEKKAIQFIKKSKVPIWNGKNEKYHPFQILGDLITIKEHYGTLKNKKIVFCGNGRSNISNSLMIACGKLGIDFVCCAPKELWPSDELFNKCKKNAEETQSKIVFTEDIMDATYNADIIYTSSWLNLSDESIQEEYFKLLSPYQINKRIMYNAKSSAIFLHDLPASHNKDTVVGQMVYEKYGIDEFEVTNEVFESKNSKVFIEAENYLHAVKAVMCSTLYKGAIK